jgi:hypothetical protein
MQDKALRFYPVLALSGHLNALDKSDELPGISLLLSNSNREQEGAYEGEVIA